MNRSVRNSIYLFRAKISFAVGASILIVLMGVLTYKGISNISLEFLFTESRNFGASGGIIYQIIGSLLITIVAGVLCFPIAYGLALFMYMYTSKKVQKHIQTALFILNGVPSVIFGLFGLLLFVNIVGTGISWFVGSIILALMILPTISVAAIQSLNGIPSSFKENGFALGLNKWQVIAKISIPQSYQGAITGLLLGLARIIGETAPIMFIATAFSGVDFPSSLFEPVSTIPTHILALAQQANNPNALNNAWASGMVLLSCVLLISLIAVPLRLKQHKQ